MHNNNKSFITILKKILIIFVNFFVLGNDSKQKNFLQRKTIIRKKSLDFQSLAQLTILLISTVFIPLGCICAILFNFDPLYFYFEIFSTGLSNKKGSILIRLLYALAAVTELFKGVNEFLIFSLLFASSVNKFLKQLLSEISETQSKTLTEINLRNIFNLFKRMQIWIDYANCVFFFWATPPLVFFGVCVIIGSNYGSVRFLSRLPFYIYLLLPGVSLIGFLLICTLIPQVGANFDNSKTYLENLKMIIKTKYERKLFKSIKPFAVSVGIFGFFDKSLVITIFVTITENTISLLLTF